MNDNRTIKAENVHKAIEKQGYFYILAKKYYGEGYIGPKYIIATDDPDFREKNPKLANMVIVPVDKFLKMAEAINSSLLNDRREKFRQMHFHNDEGFFEEMTNDEGNDITLTVADMSVDPVADEVENTMIREQVFKAMNVLKELPRKRLYDYFFKGLTYRQIAEKEGVSDMAVRYSITGAIKKLKKII